MSPPRARRVGRLAAACVLTAVLVAGGCGVGSVEDPPSSAPSSTSGRPATAAGPVVTVDGTLEREGEQLAARLTLSNDGEGAVWVPDGYEGAPRSLLLPAAVGDGVVDLGWVVPPTPAAAEVPRMVLRRVAPGGTLDLASVDDPPPPEALVDTAGAPVEVTSYRLCVDAFADGAVPTGARAGGDDGSAAVAVDAIEGESTRTCGPSVPA